MIHRNYKPRFRLAATIVVVSIAVIGSLFIAQRATAEPWPSFTMTYRDWSVNRGKNNTGGYVLVRLAYENSREWRADILEDTGAPDSAGSFTQFSGNTVLGFNARFQTTANQQIPGDDKLAPDDWLVIGRINRLKATPNAVVQSISVPGILELVHTELVPCPKSVLPNCSVDSRTVTTRIRYREDNGIPLGMTVTIDGTLTREVTVIDFAIRP